MKFLDTVNIFMIRNTWMTITAILHVKFFSEGINVNRLCISIEAKESTLFCWQKCIKALQKISHLRGSIGLKCLMWDPKCAAYSAGLGWSNLQVRVCRKHITYHCMSKCKMTIFSSSNSADIRPLEEQTSWSRSM